MAGPMADLAARHESGQDSYDHYIAGAAQFTAVDVAAAGAAFAALIGDAGLRARLSAAAGGRARTIYDWSVVIGQYRALWAELAAMRAAGRGERAAPLRGEELVPRRPDPSRLFADFPTRRLTPETRLCLAPGLADAAAALARLRAIAAIPGGAARPDLLPGAEAFELMLAGLEAGPAQAGTLVAALPPAQAVRCFRTLAWLVKIDVLRLAQ
ncbi:MAG: hypothetical protein Q8S40_03695, partial [Falsiroseomonas sp.]|nr:hypothetical protein [Falsiroseomonas sp.]